MGMSSYTTVLDLASVLSPPARCPSCSAPLASEPEGEKVCFRCRSCGQRWSVELGTVSCIGHLPGPRAVDGCVSA